MSSNAGGSSIFCVDVCVCGENQHKTLCFLNIFTILYLLSILQKIMNNDHVLGLHGKCGQGQGQGQ